MNNMQDQLYAATELRGLKRMAQNSNQEIHVRDNMIASLTLLHLDPNKAKELETLRERLRLASVAEETSKRALDELALALKEVATEATQVKQHLGLAQAELEHSRSEEERLKLIMRSNAEKYRTLLEEARREADTFRNASERLRAEAEETLLAWNDKEIGLVDCLRRADQDRALALEENAKLAASIRASKEENGKLRDILKQALSESNTAKEAAEIARAENSELRRELARREEANEGLRVNVSELKRLLSEAGKVGGKNDDERDHEEGGPAEEALRGTIFDGVDSPRDEALGEDAEMWNDLDGNSRKKKALLRRFGDLLIRKRGFNKKEQCE